MVFFLIDTFDAAATVVYRAVGARGANPPLPHFGRLVNPISTMLSRKCPPHFYSSN